MLEKIREIVNSPEVRESWTHTTGGKEPNVNNFERLISIVGGILIAYTAIRRFPLSTIFAVSGGYLLYRGLSGHCPVYETIDFQGAQSQSPTFGSIDQNRASSAQQDPQTTIEPKDKLDEAVWETFPASDPPSSW